jgi:hypothetical protein
MSNNNDNLNDMMQRFAISALSRERKGEALNEEIIAGKYTGEFYIKSKDGVVLSTDILNRRKAAAENAIRMAELIGMTGDMFKVDLELTYLPSHIDYGTNVLENEPIDIPDNSTELLLNLDLDEYDISGDEFKPINTQGKVKIVLETGYTIKTIEKDLDSINYSVISLEGLQMLGPIKIVEISIEKDPNIFNADSNDRTILLHNIFVTVNN